ncbi:DICT sensory domain-containing protein [Salinirubellus sp. GCM10025818]|uniref:DICT sensory domain-containing protein n=1 Tax=Salinirubellus TaxID=2162630 RepID=UPI0030CCD0A1
MSLSELIRGVEDHEKTLTVFNADPEAVEAVEERFHDRNLTVRAERTESGRPRAFVVLSSGDPEEEEEEFVTAAGLEDLIGEGDRTDPGFDDASYRPILDHLDETMFTSYDTRQMVAASREIEDRAWRLGTGSLHAGFQYLSILEDQMDVYERLASKDGLDVHAYAYPDQETVPVHDTDLTIHVERSREIETSWFVAYDGGGVDVNKCALLAEERDPRTFYGFWTYDPDTVDWIVEYLERSYGLVESR